MMKRIFTGLACAMAIGASPLAQADVITFNSPGIVQIDNPTNIATYTEAGLNISGEAATFLPIDGSGTDGSNALLVLADSPVRLFVDGGSFDLLSATFGAYDLGTGETMGMLSIMGGGMTRLIALGALSTFSFEGFTGLQQVTLTSDISFIVDDIVINVDATEVPEPAGWGLAGLALAAMAMTRRRRQV